MLRKVTTHERDEVRHGTGDDTEDTGQEQSRVPGDSSTKKVSSAALDRDHIETGRTVLRQEEWYSPDNIARHAPECGTGEKTAV